MADLDEAILAGGESDLALAARFAVSRGTVRRARKRLHVDASPHGRRPMTGMQRTSVVLDRATAERLAAIPNRRAAGVIRAALERLVGRLEAGERIAPAESSPGPRSTRSLLLPTALLDRAAWVSLVGSEGASSISELVRTAVADADVVSRRFEVVTTPIQIVAMVTEERASPVSAGRFFLGPGPERP